MAMFHDLRRAPVLGCLALLSLAAPALAEDDPAIPMTVLDQAGELTRSRTVPAVSDRAAFDRRLAVAVREVCGYNGMDGLRPPAAYEACRDAAVADARRQLADRTGMAAVQDRRVPARL